MPGLMAIGEAACVSVHGANRLGSNSLIDLVVFGRAAAQRCGELIERGARPKPFAPGAGDEAVARLDKLRNAKGKTPTAEIRLDMQRVMQNHAAVFRTGESLQEGIAKLEQVFASFADVAVTDRSLIWNTDLIETLELDNLLSASDGHDQVGREPHREPRRAGARGLPRARRRELDEAHAVLGRRARRRALRLPARDDDHADATRSSRFRRKRARTERTTS